MAYCKRLFLNPIAEGAPSFIQAIADSSDDGGYALGNYVLIIADCHHRTFFEFPLTSPHSRKLSLAKIDRIAKVVNGFREAVYAEAKLIQADGTTNLREPEVEESD
jgi:hypothetical protein